MSVLTSQMESLLFELSRRHSASAISLSCPVIPLPSPYIPVGPHVITPELLGYAMLALAYIDAESINPMDYTALFFDISRLFPPIVNILKRPPLCACNTHASTYYLQHPLLNRDEGPVKISGCFIDVYSTHLPIFRATPQIMGLPPCPPPALSFIENDAASAIPVTTAVVQSSILEEQEFIAITHRCATCSRTFRTPRYLQRHSRIHALPKKSMPPLPRNVNTWNTISS
ncbi:hypothetical protein M422DRAFT_276540 [Sphaerobolus stellatus SS14]|uniref:C2H2-type domain-containing protein n=1 Tax=Sphaerobolus stellatus (strain SS14) TaxID=990650 RepID=A0A0C9U1S7_SPHS4|nr:hypothetical protein M422DRAFT_276540 [Sphaerobolus stellatus SS14]